MFPYNELLVISDGIEARLGTLTSGWERFMPWRTIAGDRVEPKGSLEMEVLTRGIFDKRRFLALLRHFIVFESTKGGLVKKVAGYHQFHAVNKAVECTLDAASAKGDRRVGVVWHTQGSGKSLTMVIGVDVSTRLAASRIDGNDDMSGSASLQLLIDAAGSDGRCNTFHCVDSTLFPREK